MNAAWEQIAQEFACSHADQGLRRKVASNGAETYVHQCLRCGEAVKVFKKRDVDTGAAAPFDAELRERWYRQRQERYQALTEAGRQQESAEWWAKYNRYLQTPEWQARREMVLKRAHWLCQGCGRRRATIAHHLTYERVGREMLFDLVAVCGACHEVIHPRPAANDSFDREWGTK